jgi:hypothetical protein
MPTNADQTDLSQPMSDDLSKVAQIERKKLEARNDYFINNQYSSVNSKARADGDEQGKGTGRFLDVYNPDAGSRTDVAERKNEIKINEYQPNRPYQAPR